MEQSLMLALAYPAVAAVGREVSWIGVEFRVLTAVRKRSC